MWPDAEDRRWDRIAYGGFITIPKTMPLIGRIMDEMSKNFPVSSTYNALWARTWDKMRLFASTSLTRSPSRPGSLASAVSALSRTD